MSFNRVRTAGLWIDGSTVAGSEFETFDANLANALDGLNGGAYSLAGAMSVGGASPFVNWAFDLDVQFSEHVQFGDIVRFDGFVDFFDGVGFSGSAVTMGTGSADAFTVNSFTTYNSTVIHNGTEFFYDDVNFGLFSAVTFDGPAHFNTDVFFNDNVTAAFGSFWNLAGAFFDEDVSFGANVTFGGNVSLGGGSGDTIYIGGSSVDIVYLNGIMRNGVAGRHIQTQVIGADSAASYAPVNVQHVIVPSGGITANRAYTILDDAAVDGDRTRFTNLDANFSISVKNPGGTQIAQIITGTGSRQSVDVERIAGAWRVTGWMMGPI